AVSCAIARGVNREADGLCGDVDGCDWPTSVVIAYAVTSDYDSLAPVRGNCRHVKFHSAGRRRPGDIRARSNLTVRDTADLLSWGTQRVCRILRVIGRASNGHPLAGKKISVVSLTGQRYRCYVCAAGNAGDGLGIDIHAVKPRSFVLNVIERDVVDWVSSRSQHDMKPQAASVPRSPMPGIIDRHVVGRA